MADMEQQPQTTKRRRVVADSAAPDLAGLNPAVARAMAGGDAATDAAVSCLAQAFRARTDCDESATVGIVVNGTPFPTCTIDGLLNPALLDRVQTELLALPRQPKSNDLYHFEQTPDLVNVTSPALTQLREILYSQAFVGLIGKLGGVTLNRQMDMSGHRYPPAGYLLCHDDELEGRRIAYIFYLVDEGWSMDDGGRLELFDMDAHGQPKDVVHRLVPRRNTLAFFEVTPDSFHQVSEVLSDTKDRYSISGWFYCDERLPRPPPYVEPVPPRTPLPPSVADDAALAGLAAWLRPEYLRDDARAQLRHKFVDESSVQLVQLLREDRYAAAVEALRSAGPDAWVRRGPANRRQCEVLADGWAQPAALADLAAFLQSRPFLDYVHAFTVTPLDGGHFQLQLAQWRHGSYTLVHDDALEEPGLDVIFTLTDTAKPWSEDAGGDMVYMAEQEHLLSVPPVGNSLSVVLRDDGVMRFVRFANHRTGDRVRWDLSLVFPTRPPADNA